MRQALSSLLPTFEPTLRFTFDLKTFWIHEIGDQAVPRLLMRNSNALFNTNLHIGNSQ